MSKLNQYLEAIKKSEENDPELILEKKLHNLDRSELIDMIKMYKLKISKMDIDDSDDDELIDYLLQGLSKKNKEKLAKE